jgi:hypothetical protein
MTGPNVDKAVIETLRLMGLKQWEAACKRAQRLVEGPKVSVDSKAKEQK